MDEDLGMDLLTIEDENGETFDLEVLGSFEVNGQEYMAALPADTQIGLAAQDLVQYLVCEIGGKRIPNEAVIALYGIDSDPRPGRTGRRMVHVPELPQPPGQ